METGCHPFIDERCTFTVSHKEHEKHIFFSVKVIAFLGEYRGRYDKSYTTSFNAVCDFHGFDIFTVFS